MSTRTILDEMAAWSGPAYWLALRAAGSPEAAEDAVQEAYVQALARLGGGEGVTGEPARLRFLNLVADRARVEKRSAVRRRKREGAVAGPTKTEPQAEELRLDARAALEALEEELRLAVHLCCEQGLSQREAAEVLGVPERTLSRRVADGLERLRGALEAAGFAAAPAAILSGLAGSAPAVPATLAARIDALIAAKAAGTLAAGAGATATATAAAGKGALLAKIGLFVAAAALAAGAAVWAAGRHAAPTGPAEGRILWIGSGSAWSLMAEAERVFRANGGPIFTHEKCGRFFRIDQVSEQLARGDERPARRLLEDLKADIAAERRAYVAIQVSGAILRSEEQERRVPEVLDELCAAIAASGARPLLFEQWSKDPAKMRGYCLAAARRHGGAVVFCGSAGDEVRTAGGLRYLGDSDMAGPLGNYLCVCCLYAALTGRSPEGLPPPELPFGTTVRLGRGSDAEIAFSPDDVLRIQRGAWEVHWKYSRLIDEAGRQQP